MSTMRFSSLSMSSASSARTPRGTSVHGGAGGRNVRVSYASSGLGSSFDLSHALGGGGGGDMSLSVSGNEKATMQNLNDRLASYLDKVRSLETANAQLERQIREWYDKKAPATRDYSRYQVIIDELRQKISAATTVNTTLMLQIDNARLAGEDFRMKFETEQSARMSVEVDIAGLRKVLDELTMTRSDLEMQVEGLKEELVFMKKNHKEEMAAQRSLMATSSVNVEVDAKPQEDLNQVLVEIRAQYESITEKNRRDMESWYKGKFEDLNRAMASSTETLQTSRTEITDLKRTLQGLQIELQSQLSLKAAMEGTLSETETRYSLQLQSLQCRVNDLEEELSQVRVDIRRQSSEYQMLLDIKTRLELEIAEYRRLLDGESTQKITTIEVKEEKRKPVITQRTKVVIEELIDGKVVSRTEDVDTEVLSK
ncbi:keratin 97 [Nematolebias whitei]|uniref:keratin 97 n=1 Tax=Nematolebias whitei TaxID=451745 RepID=UPI00189990FD|nr:keratin 97 [Nematolebias whitei]